MNLSIKETLYQPVFSAVLAKRTETAAIAGFGAVHIGLSLVGISFWSCPILAATGIPCPGCGLTRATMQLLHGNFKESFHIHAFAPVFLAALVIMLAALVLPEPNRNRLIGIINRLETRNGITTWVFFFLMFYWAFRLMA